MEQQAKQYFNKNSSFFPGRRQTVNHLNQPQTPQNPVYSCKSEKQEDFQASFLKIPKIQLENLKKCPNSPSQNTCPVNKTLYQDENSSSPKFSSSNPKYQRQQQFSILQSSSNDFQNIISSENQSSFLKTPSAKNPNRYVLQDKSNSQDKYAKVVYTRPQPNAPTCPKVLQQKKKQGDSTQKRTPTSNNCQSTKNPNKIANPYLSKTPNSVNQKNTQFNFPEFQRQTQTPLTPHYNSLFNQLQSTSYSQSEFMNFYEQMEKKITILNSQIEKMQFSLISKNQELSKKDEQIKNLINTNDALLNQLDISSTQQESQKPPSEEKNTEITYLQSKISEITDLWKKDQIAYKSQLIEKDQFIEQLTVQLNQLRSVKQDFQQLQSQSSVFSFRKQIDSFSEEERISRLEQEISILWDEKHRLEEENKKKEEANVFLSSQIKEQDCQNDNDLSATNKQLTATNKKLGLENRKLLELLKIMQDCKQDLV